MKNVYIYGFLEPQSIKKVWNKKMECHTYIHWWIDESKKINYMTPFINA